MTSAFDRYELDRAVTPVGLFVDDLSTWYIRRSRDRFKSDEPKERAEALSTTRVVLLELSKLLAPVMPFLAEHIYQSIQGAKESVHLDSWPTFSEPNYADLASMAEARRVVSLALEARAKAGIKVRQPLGKLTIKDTLLVGKKELADIILDELNVEEVVIEAGELAIELDTNITPALKRKGQYRDLLRTVQELRKQTGLTPSDVVELFVQTNDDGRALVEEFSAELKKASLLKEITYKGVSGETVDIDGMPFTLSVAK